MEDTKTENKENVAVVRARSLNISSKVAVEVCNFIRGKKLERAMKMLEMIAEKKLAVPYKIHNKDVPHRAGRGIAAGRYPMKTAKMFIKLLNSLKSNAENNGLNTKDMTISKAISNKGAKRWHYGRIRGIKMKVTHIELEAREETNKK